jgi:hypothetical protein
MNIIIKLWNKALSKVMKWTLWKNNVMNTAKNDRISTLEKWMNDHCQKEMEWTLWKSDGMNTVKKRWNEHNHEVMK